MTISEFRGEHAFLSNFYHAPMNTPIGICSTVEHYFQACKTNDRAQQNWVLGQPTPGDAKRAGRTVQLRPDWEAVKIPIMRQALWSKFVDNSQLARKLISTGAQLLVEGTTWGDEFWGIDVKRLRGFNWLGHLLMARRAELVATMTVDDVR